MLAEPVPRPRPDPGMQGAKPRQNKLIVSPFPGKERSASAGGGILPLRGRGRKASYRQGRQATKRASPSGHLPRRFSPCRFSAQARGCKGRSPLHKKKTKILFPGGKGSSSSFPFGEGGQKSKLKAGRQVAKQISSCYYRIIQKTLGILYKAKGLQTGDAVRNHSVPVELFLT